MNRTYIQKRCNSKFHIFKRFDSDWRPHQLRIYFYKKYKGRNLEIARVTDKHCGKNDINELYM